MNQLIGQQNMAQNCGQASNASLAGANGCVSSSLGYYGYGIGQQSCCTQVVYSYPQYILSDSTQFDIKIRKVENGWILIKDGKEHVLTKPEQALKYFEEEK